MMGTVDKLNRRHLIGLFMLGVNSSAVEHMFSLWEICDQPQAPNKTTNE